MVWVVGPNQNKGREVTCWWCDLKIFKLRFEFWIIRDLVGSREGSWTTVNLQCPTQPRSGRFKDSGLSDLHLSHVKEVDVLWREITAQCEWGQHQVCQCVTVACCLGPPEIWAQGVGMLKLIIFMFSVEINCFKSWWWPWLMIDI